MKIAVLAYDGFTDVDLFLPWDFLWRVKVPYGAGYTGPWQPMICSDKPLITSYSGVQISVAGTMADIGDADGVFIVSGDGSRDKLADAQFMASLKLDPARQRIAAIDSGVLFLAALGLLKGKTATTYPTVFPELEAMGVTPERKALVAHGSIATGGGCLALTINTDHSVGAGQFGHVQSVMRLPFNDQPNFARRSCSKAEPSWRVRFGTKRE